MARDVRRHPVGALVAAALAGSCSDDGPTSPAFVDVTGFELAVRQLVHQFQAGPRWRFSADVAPDPLPPATIRELRETAGEATLVWTPPGAPHAWGLDLYRRTEEGGGITLALVTEGPSGTSDGDGETLDATVPLEAIEPGGMYALFLTLVDEETDRSYRVDGLRPGS